MAERPQARIWVRLAAAFVTVALIAVALVATATTVFAGRDVSVLVDQQRQELADAVAVAAAASWDRTNSWRVAAIAPVLDLAARDGADVELVDFAGRRVAAAPGFTHGRHVATRTVRIEVAGQFVGTARLRYTGAGIDGAGAHLRSSLLDAIVAASALAVLLALLVAVGAARRITRPVERLTAVAQAMRRGDRGVRAGPIRAPAELGELAAGFDAMAEAVEREDRFRRTLVADVAHELRTPVAVLQAGHEALLDGVSAPSAEQLASLRDEVLRLTRMVNDLQALSSAETAALQLSLEPADLGEIAAAAAASMAPQFETAELTLVQRLESVTVRADPHWMHQIVTNLLSNALKYTPAGGRAIVAVTAEHLHARLAVSDTGRGIPPADVPHVFDRFWRGRNGTGVAGSGIGLAIVATLAQAHNATIDINSGLGNGTTVTLTMAQA